MGRGSFPDGILTRVWSWPITSIRDLPPSCPFPQAMSRQDQAPEYLCFSLHTSYPEAAADEFWQLKLFQNWNSLTCHTKIRIVSKHKLSLSAIPEMYIVMRCNNANCSTRSTTLLTEFNCSLLQFLSWNKYQSWIEPPITEQCGHLHDS
jgi:hypothetical protein